MNTRLFGLITSMLLPTSAGAQFEPTSPDSNCGLIAVELGARSDAPFRQGPLAGMSTGSGGFGLLDLVLCRTLAPEQPRHWRIEIDDLGGRQPALDLTMGEAGRWRLEAGFDRIARTGTFVQSPMREADDRSQQLPPGWVPAASTAGMPALLPSLVPAHIERERERARLAASAILGQHWQLDARYREDRVRGRQPFGGAVGSTGGNVRAIVLAMPIDQRTRNADLGLVHAGKKLQVRAGLLLSDFENAIDSYRWQNPFAGVGGWQAAANSPAPMQAQPAPDNRFHQLSLSAGYSLSPSLRFNADLSIGRMRQDQAFLPYTSVPALLATLSVPLPRPDLDGRIDTRLLNLKLAARPQGPWQWDARLRIDDRDNRTPSSVYRYIGGDSTLQETSADSGRLRINLAPSYRQRDLGLGAGWHSSRRLQIDLELTDSDIDRTGSARSDVDEQRLRARLKFRPVDSLDLGLRAARAERDGASYVGSRDYVDSHSPEYIASVSGGWENLPGLRQFHLADRIRHELSAFAQWQPAERSALGLSYAWLRDDYRTSEFGLTDSRIRNLQLDLSHGFSDALWLHASAGREWLDADQAGRAFSGGAARPAQSIDPNRNWFVSHRDTVDTLGLGLSYRPASSPWSLRADVSRSDASGAIDVRTASALTSAPLPNTRAGLTRAELGLDYQLRSHLDLGLHYRLERFDSADFAHDGTAPNTLANVILLGDESPDYRAQGWWIRVAYRFE
jgi:MtrB/PioB family decaheme-associated outer membrane protein